MIDERYDLKSSVGAGDLHADIVNLDNLLDIICHHQFDRIVQPTDDRRVDSLLWIARGLSNEIRAALDKAGGIEGEPS
ncbi:hypothetical protein [Mesorhizobium sp. CN2-181]|uniref:hypothetical protein n=1 Tax=Mesorhizobium yinganensis TaxID=3157707 RepID=UPI0032B79211